MHAGKGGLGRVEEQGMVESGLENVLNVKYRLRVARVAACRHEDGVMGGGGGLCRGGRLCARSFTGSRRRGEDGAGGGEGKGWQWREGGKKGERGIKM